MGESATRTIQPTARGRRRWAHPVVWGVLILISLPNCGSGGRGGGDSRTLYVKAGATSGGTGARTAPFASLSAVEGAAGPGAMIVVLPTEPGVAPLDGGITLKRGQRLIGEGADVRDAPSSAPTARITNASKLRQGGNAVVLAEESAVENIHIVDAARAAIHGSNVGDTEIVGTLITGHNQLDEGSGSVIPGFGLGGVPILPALEVKAAAIELLSDGDSTRILRTTLRDNVVRDGRGSGILLDASGSSKTEIVGDGNTFERLAGRAAVGGLVDVPSPMSFDYFFANLDQGTEAVPLVVTTAAIYVITRETSTATLGFAHTSVADIEGGDSDMIILSPLERSAQTIHFYDLKMRVPAAVGKDCIIVYASDVDGATIDLDLERSEIRGCVGDAVTLTTFGNDASVRALIHDTTIAEIPGVAQGSTAGLLLQGGNAVSITDAGNNNSYQLDIRDSVFSDLKTAGIVVQNAGSGGVVGVDLRNTTIERGRRWNFVVDTNTPYASGPFESLTIRGSDVDLLDSAVALQVSTRDDHFLTDAGGAVAELPSPDEDAPPLRTLVDFGGGAAGSGGGNRIVGNAVDVRTRNLDVAATRNWWGDPAGPANLEEDHAVVDVTPVLAFDPRP